MITIGEKTVDITISEEDLLKAIAYMKDLKDYAENYTGKHIDELRTAEEVLEAFWAEHFGETKE